MQAAIDAARVQRTRLAAGVNPEGLLCQVEVVRGCCRVYRRAGFQFKRGELLRSLNGDAVGCGCRCHRFAFKPVDSGSIANHVPTSSANSTPAQ